MNPKRSLVSLLTALSFLVLAVTGILAFVRPFSIRIVGLHALIGFVFIGLDRVACIQQSRSLEAISPQQRLLGDFRVSC